jgi:hypothetical protein
MARFQLTRAFAYDGGQHRVAAGKIITDIAPARGSETSTIYWPALSSQTLGQGFVPLDASAIAMKAASVYANEIIQTPSGADSIS